MSLKITLRSNVGLEKETMCVLALTKSPLYVYQPVLSCVKSMWSLKEL